jgi:hypothetical protein
MAKTNSGELRKTLLDCIEQVRTGKMSHQDAKAVALLAGQVNLSLQVELNVRREEATAAEFGELPIADEQEPKAIEHDNEGSGPPDPSIVARGPWTSVRRHTLKG